MKLYAVPAVKLTEPYLYVPVPFPPYHSIILPEFTNHKSPPSSEVNPNVYVPVSLGVKVKVTSAE